MPVALRGIPCHLVTVYRVSPVERVRSCSPLRQGWTESNWGGEEKGVIVPAPGRPARCPEPRSQLAVHLLPQGHSQQQADCGTLVPGSRSCRL